MNYDSPNGSDPLNALIIQRLGLQQKKKEQMAAWERRVAHRRLRLPLYSVAAAAVLTGVLLVSPLLAPDAKLADSLTSPTAEFEVFRSASPQEQDIVALIDKGDYEQALSLCREQLRGSDTVIEQWQQAVQDSLTEELQYERECEWMRNEQLRWTLIYLLARTGREDEATQEIRLYLQRYPTGIHQSEARDLLTDK